MPHVIILGDEIDCIKTKLDTLNSTYNELKEYRDDPGSNLTKQREDTINAALHLAEHLAQDICQGNDLDSTLDGVIEEMQELLP